MTGAPAPSGSHPDQHVPVTPAWTCDSCGEEWPCPTKRNRLLSEYQMDRASLSVYLRSCLAAASADLRAAPMASLQDRVIGWVPRGPLAT